MRFRLNSIFFSLLQVQEKYHVCCNYSKDLTLEEAAFHSNNRVQLTRRGDFAKTRLAELGIMASRNN